MLGLMIGMIILMNTIVLSAILYLSNRYRKVRRQYESVHYKLIQLNQELDIARFTIRKLVDREIEHDEVSSNVRCQPTDYGKEAV